MLFPLIFTQILEKSYFKKLAPSLKNIWIGHHYSVALI